LALRSTEQRWLAAALTVAGFTIILDQVSILASGVLPLNTGMVQWRFGAVGLAIGRATPLLIADALLLAGVALAPNRWWSRALGAIHLLVAGLLLGALAVFVLDAAEMRRLVALERQQALLVSAVRVIGVGGLAAMLTAWLGVRLFRLPARPPGRRTSEEVLMVGSQAP